MTATGHNVQECWECGIVAEVHHHHPVPRSRGGVRTIPLCLACHAKAHHRDRRMSSSVLVSEAIARNIQRGGRHGGLPLGETLADSTAQGRANGRRDVVTVEAEARAVRRILELRRAGASYRVICETLTAEGHATKAGGEWHPNTVRRVALRAGL